MVSAWDPASTASSRPFSRRFSTQPRGIRARNPELRSRSGVTRSQAHGALCRIRRWRSLRPQGIPYVRSAGGSLDQKDGIPASYGSCARKLCRVPGAPGLQCQNQPGWRGRVRGQCGSGTRGQRGRVRGQRGSGDRRQLGDRGQRGSGDRRQRGCRGQCGRGDRGQRGRRAGGLRERQLRRRR